MAVNNMAVLESAFDEMIQRDMQAMEDIFGRGPGFAQGGIVSQISWESAERFLNTFRADGRMGRGSGILREAWGAMEETPATASEIHAAFDEASGEEEKRALRILEYRQMYPSNPFLTRDQVKALCLKYNLVMAPDFMFAGEIPERNQAERAAFKLHKTHETCGLEESEIIRRMSDRRFDASPRRGFGYEPTMPLPENVHAPWLMVVNTDFALYCPQGFDALRRWMSAYFGGDRAMYYPDFYKDIPAIPIVHTKAGFVRLHPRAIRPESFSIERQEMEVIDAGRFWAHFTMPRTVCRFRFYAPEVHSTQALYADGVCQMVVCPGNMLQQNMSIELSQGWEATFSVSQRNPAGRGADPIILQPVEGGFLLVTKWDAEALLPEVAGQTN